MVISKVWSNWVKNSPQCIHILCSQFWFLYLQHIGGQRDLFRRRGPFQPDVGAVDDAGLLGPRTAAVNGTGTAALAAVRLRRGAPYFQAAERHKQTGKETKPREADAMFSLG